MRIGGDTRQPTPTPPPADVPTVRLVEGAGSTPEAWAALGLGSIRTGAAVHARALTAGLEATDGALIADAVRKGAAMVQEHRGPIPSAWRGRMQQLHRRALLELWEVDGRENTERVFQVLGAIPTRWGPWLDEGIERLDRTAKHLNPEVALRAAGLAVVERAVDEWLNFESEKKG